MLRCLLMYFSDEVEFRWTGNKLFLPGDANKPVGEVYNTYVTGDMARYYSSPFQAPKCSRLATTILDGAGVVYRPPKGVVYFG